LYGTYESDPAGSGSNAHGVNIKFTASSDTLYVYAIATSARSIRGNGTKGETFIQLTRSTDDSGFIAEAKTEAYKYANNKTSAEKVVGTWFGCPLYEKSYRVAGMSSGGNVVDSGINSGTITPVNSWALNAVNGFWYSEIFGVNGQRLILTSSDLQVNITDTNYNTVNFTIQYTKVSECP